MASGRKKSISLKKYKSRRELNIGIFLFAVVLIYLVVTVFMYLTGDNISVYEVRKGSIVNDNSYTGLIIREETSIEAEAGGYISYYQNENSKVKSGTDIYAVSKSPLDTELSGDNEENGISSASLNQEVQSGIALDLQSFNENFDSQNFSSVYSLKNEISNTLQNALSETRTEHLDAVIAASGEDVSSFQADRDGIVAFSVDGYESLTKDIFTSDSFDRSDYENTVLSDGTYINAGEPVYRMITSEDWSVIVPLEKETAEALAEDETQSVRVRIDKDSETLWADFSILEKGEDYYGCLDFDNSMIRYADERFLNIELILEDETGLKIPKSSVVEENFYVIPEDYITTGGNSSSDGVMVRDSDGSGVFQEISVFDITEDGEAYVSREDLSEGDVLIRPESSETYTVEEVRTLTGVYNINRGYAVFKKVTILCENDEYYIVQEGEDYGLYNYDHIVQDGSGVRPDEVVFQ